MTGDCQFRDGILLLLIQTLGLLLSLLLSSLSLLLASYVITINIIHIDWEDIHVILHLTQLKDDFSLWSLTAFAKITVVQKISLILLAMRMKCAINDRRSRNQCYIVLLSVCAGRLGNLCILWQSLIFYAVFHARSLIVSFINICVIKIYIIYSAVVKNCTEIARYLV